MIKKILIAVFIIILIGISTAYYMWNKPHPQPKNGIRITAQNLAKEYTANENEADRKYLNKAIEVSGIINEVDKNQDGGIMVVLQTDDPAAGVQCTLRDKNTNPAKGQNIVITGFCSGNGITGVSLTDCIIK